MAEPFKNFINAEGVEAAAHHLARAWPDFDAAGFITTVAPRLEALELKARAMCVADALERFLPADFLTAAPIIERALAPVEARAGQMVTAAIPGGLAGWFCWPVGEFVARRGLPHPDRALHCLREITKRFTAEFAIRPFVQTYPALVFETLAAWVHDPDEHVRRLVSEGTRPRLPWGMQLRALVANPSPALPLLEALLDDPSDYVRRSVANHLNDISRDHPDVVADFIERHLGTASAERRALLRHASRTLVKRGHARTLHAWGRGAPFEGSVELRLSPASITMGERLQLDVVLISDTNRDQPVTVDYIVHHVRRDGLHSPKVFKGWQATVGSGESVVLRRTHHVKPITTRRYYSGVHRVDVQVNGVACAAAEFVLVLSPSGTPPEV